MRTSPGPWSRIGAAFVAVLAAGCGPFETGSTNRFTETGELIALSGGGAGAANACFTCHGLDGLGDGVGAPRLAGIDIGYLERQLEAYGDGRRKHAEMGWIAKHLSPDERKRVAAYYATMAYSPGAMPPGVPPTLYASGDPDRGLPACASCHGQFGEGIGAGNPPLGGQPSEYLLHQMEQWRRAKRRNDPGDVMLRISQSLTPSEAVRLTAYGAALPGGPPNSEPPAASP